eukprot:scaffold58923_cov66-Phaeocystis_antarctica.AAC.5
MSGSSRCCVAQSCMTTRETQSFRRADAQGHYRNEGGAELHEQSAHGPPHTSHRVFSSGISRGELSCGHNQRPAPFREPYCCAMSCHRQGSPRTGGPRCVGTTNTSELGRALAGRPVVIPRAEATAPT